MFGDDPTVNALQERIAAMLGKEAALFVPSGTQSNLVAIMSHCQRGDEYIVGQMAHTYRWEGGGAAVLGSVQPQPLEHQPDGTLALRTSRPRSSPTIRISRAAACWRWRTRSAARCCRWPTWSTRPRWRAGAAWRPHLDGARLFNAAVAIGGDRGAPRATSRARISTASRSASRKAWARRSARRWSARASSSRGRTAGARCSAAACARPGCWRRRRSTRSITTSSGWPTTTRSRSAWPKGLQGLPGLTVEPPQTNIVFADLQGPRAAGLMEHLKSRGVLATGLYRLRFVTHLDVDAAGVDRAVAAVREHLTA